MHRKITQKFLILLQDHNTQFRVNATSRIPKQEFPQDIKNKMNSVHICIYKKRTSSKGTGLPSPERLLMSCTTPIRGRSRSPWGTGAQSTDLVVNLSLEAQGVGFIFSFTGAQLKVCVVRRSRQYPVFRSCERSKRPSTYASATFRASPERPGAAE